MSAERYKDECCRLRAEVASRREETRQLQQRVRLLEGTLQVRMQELEGLVEEIRKATGTAVSSSIAEADNRRLTELLDRIIHEARRTQVVLHCHADSDARLEAKDRLLEQAQKGLEQKDVLKEQLIESQLETKRLVAKVRNTDPQCLRQKLEQARRTAKKQDELLADYERTQHELHERMEVMKYQLEDERRARKDLEKTKQRLLCHLEEGRTPGSATALGEMTMLTPTAAAAAGAGAQLRRELDALRDDERATRRMRRRQDASRHRTTEGSIPASPETGVAVGGASASSARCRSQGRSEEDDIGQDGKSRSSGGGREEDDIGQDGKSRSSGGGRESAATAALRVAFERIIEERSNREAKLREELADAERRWSSLEECHASDRLAAQAGERYTRLELEVSERQIAGSEALAVEAARVEGQIWEEARRAECRAWTLAEVANELALHADFREINTIQAELDMQRELQAAECRCATMSAVANRITSAVRDAGVEFCF